MANQKRISANKSKTKSPKRDINISGSISLMKKSLLSLWMNRKFWLVFLLIYFLVDLVFVRGISGNLNIGSLRNEFTSVFSGSGSKLNASLSVLLVLMGSNSSSTTGGSSATGFFIFIFGSLAIIWSLDKLNHSNKITVKDALYNGVSPVIPFLLVIFYIGVQLIPVTIGALLYSTVKNNGIAVGGLEQSAWLIIFLLSGFWSLYMTSSSLFAPFYVTLQNQSPVKAIKAASASLTGLRFKLMGRLLTMLLSLLLAIVVVMVVGILILGNIASWLFFLISIVILPIIIGYLYQLYLEIK